MMRYSEISRELSSDSLRFAENSENYIYRNLRDESPNSDISNNSGPLSNSPTLKNNTTINNTPESRNNFYYREHRLSSISNNGGDMVDQYQCMSPSKSITMKNGIKQPFQQSDGVATVSTTEEGILSSAFYLPSGCRYSDKRDSNKTSNSVVANNSINSNSTISPGGGSFLSRNNSKDCDNISVRGITISGGSNNGSGSGKSSRRKNSIGSALGSACLTAMSSSPTSGCYYHYGSTPPAKTQSLPPNASIKNYDEVIMSALRVSAEELANQITLLDFPCFAAIQPDELTSCAWTKKDKHVNTPNIVAFTKRFNHTSFWTVQEILSGDTPKFRAEILTHFIKVAKKLYELNNLHSLFAIISAMQSASIYRLKKTWSCLSKKDKQSFDRLADIFSDQNNWENLREYLESLRLPCIPYLGLYLTDLIYIDLAHPHSGGLEPEQRRNKMNNILRMISNYQHSDYRHIVPIERTQKYLQSIRYIEELQNIFEEDQYKKSLKLEPSSSVPSSSSCSSKESFNVDAAPALACLNLSPAKTGSVRISNTGAQKFIPGHRKCRSLGSNIFGKFNSTHHHHHHPEIVTADGSECLANIHQLPRHLLDDSVLEDQVINSHCQKRPSSGTQLASDATSTGSSDGVLFSLDIDAADYNFQSLSFQGCVRRKTILKEGRKPVVVSWQRYWLQIWANSLVYFPPKSFKGSERTDFKREPCKVCPLDGWSAQVSDNSKHKNTFELYNPTLGTVYKFRTDCVNMTERWVTAICKASSKNFERPLPANLMSFE
ncbi:ras-specific guanine nucleotide-releasing factor RalGPS1-like isoform X2 [Condylostylus longicornis]|uniref:ras-specific guanine nucleotide-releasing factor RalGPS1-like isoform X2 n=1 Tax=Condylostylus longicornis TaxID=2530218 RepID=UPI00244DA128|nr:ras-specific guanine nucleotide-releasing factor RalGPS1-like isoform X2 [Condylostylus longicornis]